MAACSNCGKRNVILFLPEGVTDDGNDPGAIQPICSLCGGKSSYD
mgnify:FL=1|tara:strand:- start:84 stop:218 length:135 start_codon:yes stop_codon:yes gene_type:complete